jgi:hypothetical protein
LARFHPDCQILQNKCLAVLAALGGIPAFKIFSSVIPLDGNTRISSLPADIIIVSAGPLDRYQSVD